MLTGKTHHIMANFFHSDTYTEFFISETNEVWVFGDRPANITEETPHQFVARDSSWGDGTEQEMELPITDGHGNREWVTGRFYVGEPCELRGTIAGDKIAQFYAFNDINPEYSEVD